MAEKKITIYNRHGKAVEKTISQFEHADKFFLSNVGEDEVLLVVYEGGTNICILDSADECDAPQRVFKGSVSLSKDDLDDLAKFGNVSEALARFGGKVA